MTALATPSSLPPKTAALIEQTLEHMGFELVRLRLMGGKVRSVLQIMAEPSDGSVMTIEGCEAISRRLSPLLEVEDPIADAYNLEVSSPGLDRPLVRLKDFDRFKGYEAKIELSELDNGRRKFRGILKGHSDNQITIEEEGQDYTVAFDNIRDAKLIVTEELIQQALKGTMA
jgi:ribosome maturation factor RimP